MIKNYNAEKKENQLLWALGMIPFIAGLFYFIRPLLVGLIMPDVLGVFPNGVTAFMWWFLPTFALIILGNVLATAYSKSLLNTFSFEIDGELVVCSVEGFGMGYPTYEKVIKLFHVTHDGLNVLPDMNASASSTKGVRYAFKTESGRSVTLMGEQVKNGHPKIDVNVDGELVISKNVLIKNRLSDRIDQA